MASPVVTLGFGFPGPGYVVTLGFSFSDGEVVLGPYCVEKVSSYSPWATTGDYAAGKDSRVSSYTPGSTVIQTACS